LRKIGIYGGTFSPIHHGHLILAREALERLHLDEVRFVTAALSPDKDRSLAADCRFEMVQAAIAGEPEFVADDAELQRPPPSYSVDTVRELRERMPDARFFWLVGADHVRDLPTWKEFDELERLVQFVVLDRGDGAPTNSYPTVKRKIGISGSDIRKRVAAGESIRYLVPPAVEEIIRTRGLYKEQKQ
jgi:nicotinate-nucleotide adenylyltransferase